MRGDGSVIRRGRVWYTRIYVGGKEIRTSTGATNRDDAIAQLKAAREASRDSGPRGRALNAGLRKIHTGTLSGADVCALRRPLVYAWFRGEEVLYVGKGAMGMYRPLHPKHHRLHDIAPDDELRFWACANAAEAEAFESQLIKRWRPRLNRRHIRTAHERDQARMATVSNSL
jgi:hypothetical protein